MCAIIVSEGVGGVLHGGMPDTWMGSMHERLSLPRKTHISPTIPTLACMHGHLPTRRHMEPCISLPMLRLCKTTHHPGLLPFTSQAKNDHWAANAQPSTGQ